MTESNQIKTPPTTPTAATEPTKSLTIVVPEEILRVLPRREVMLSANRFLKRLQVISRLQQ